MPHARSLLAASLLVFAACTSPPTPAMDSSLPESSVDAQGPCLRSEDCDDRLFCNGAERCAPGAPGADARGCVRALAGPCASGTVCDEALLQCRVAPDAAPDANCDADGDGVTGPQCGGMDCDDNDPDRFPGNRERCRGALRNGTRADAHDEDCNPCTVNDTMTPSDGDLDGDGYASALCSNPWLGASAPVGCDPMQVVADPAGGRAEFGTDCNDGNRSVNPNAPEVCGNGMDDNCNGMVDEDQRGPVYRDVDNDGRGDSSGAPGTTMTTSLCNIPVGWVANHQDCDDTRPETYTGAREQCDRRDNDCSNAGALAGGAEPAEDMDSDRHSPPGAACLSPTDPGGLATSFPKDDCDDAHASAHPGLAAADEQSNCDGVDNDCDPLTREQGSRCAAGGSCGAAGSCVRPFTALGLAAGLNHACVVVANGEVHCWGSNSVGQRGDGGYNNRGASAARGTVPFVSVAAGRYHTCALDNVGDAWCWGDNQMARQVGDGTTIGRLVPTRVRTSGGYVQLASGRLHSCAVRLDGAVDCWGSNSNGQLGDGTTTMPTGPVRVAGLADAVAVAPGATATCALRRGGTVSCWGDGGQGQLGDGTNAQRPTPGPVPSLTNIVGLAAGSNHFCALRADGTASCWGSNSQGQLGDGTLVNRNAPVLVAGLAGAAQLVAGEFHSCARGTDGSARCWGSNSSNQLGDGTTTMRAAPVSVAGLSAVAQLAAGEGFNCALRTDGAVWCWGGNLNGQLGDGLNASHGAAAATVLPTVAELGLGNVHSCARLNEGTLYCWGGNVFGQLGDGTTTQRGAPTVVPSPVDFVGLGVGGTHTCGARADGTAWCWGGNGNGQLGDGTIAAHSAPAPVGTSFTNVTDVAGGGASSCALKSDATVWCWGANNSGQLGDNSGPLGRNVPGAVPMLTSATALALGASHACALRADGSLWCWGANSNGQLGDGTATLRVNPVPVPGLAGLVSVGAGQAHTCARRNDGAVFCWGANSNNQVTPMNMMDQLRPVQTAGLSGAVELAVGGYHNCARRMDGTVLCWGGNGNGQLGDGTTAQRGTPAAVTGLAGATMLGAGLTHSCARRADGAVFCWGSNSAGQLGVGMSGMSTAPVQVLDL